LIIALTKNWESDWTANLPAGFDSLFSILNLVNAALWVKRAAIVVELSNNKTLVSTLHPSI